MRLKNLLLRLTFVALTLCSVSANDAVLDWIYLANRYTAQSNLPNHWEIKRGDKVPPEIGFEDLVRALPAPEFWDEIRASYHAKSQAHPAQTTLVELLLAYLDNDAVEVEALLQRLESHESIRADSLRKSFIRDSELIAPENQIASFIAQLSEHVPVSREELITSLEGQITMKEIDAYLEAQKAIAERYQALYQNGLTPDELNQMQALNKEATEVFKKYDDAAKYIRENQNNTLLKKYIESQQVNVVSHNRYIPSIQVPDIVNITSEKEARRLLHRALTARVHIYFESADATRRLAQEMALQYINDLKAPQWRLVQDFDHLELYEQMAAKFPESDSDRTDYQRERAEGYYFWSLVAAGRSEDAIRIIAETPELEERLPYSAVNDLKKAGYATEVWDFLDQLLERYPHVDLWDRYLSLSAELNKHEAMLATVQLVIQAESTSVEDRISKQTLLAAAYLTAGKVDLGFEQLLNALEPEAASPDIVRAQVEAGIKLAETAQLLNREAELQTALSKLAELQDALPLLHDNQRLDISDQMELAELYQTIGQVQDAYDLLEDWLNHANAFAGELVAKTKAKEHAPDTPYYLKAESLSDFHEQHSSIYRRILTSMVQLSIELGDHANAQYLLTGRVEWMASDLKKLLTQTGLHRKGAPLGYTVAQLCHLRNDDAAASRILEAFLIEANGYDPAYELYLEINGADAIPYFNKLYAVDQFQERPLIWKAQYTLDEGELEQAETLALQAIEIDPSDGEQPRGDRMRVYGIMARIREAQGNAQEAAFFDEVLAAIRLSEEADRYYSAGLYDKAIARYRESLTHFQDAYCIQSRIAVRLYDQGHVDEAVKYYRKAYELMPSSFGRVESHCFGCESVFKGEAPQSIAEEVFTGLLKAQPEVPQVHYLIGYLRDYQNRDAEALTHFKDAVELDPEYLNAWKKILHLSKQMSMDTKTKDDLALKIYSLDPLGQHSSPNLSEVSNIKQLWQLVLEKQATIDLLQPKNEKIFTFSTAAEALKEFPPEQNNWYNRNQLIREPYDALNNNKVLRSISELFIQLSHLPKPKTA